jgi:hypothetical protein
VVARITKPSPHRLHIATEQSDVGEPADGVRDPALATRRPEHCTGFLQRGLGVIEPPPRERKIDRSPQGAGKTRPVAGLTL